MDGLVWLGVGSIVIGAALFAIGMRHDPILAAAVPVGSGLMTAILLYLIFAVDSPSPVPQATAGESEKQSTPAPLAAPVNSPQDFVNALQSKPAATNSQGTVDLLALIGPQPNRVMHLWSMQGGALVSQAVPSIIPSKMWIPYRPPASYQLTAVVERLSGHESISFGLPIAGRDVMVCIDGFQQNISGINLIDRSTADRNESRRVGPFIRGRQPHTIVCTVGPDSIHVTVNGRVAVDWKGDVNRLSLDRRWPHGPPGHLHVGSWQTSFRISRLELKPLS